MGEREVMHLEDPSDEEGSLAVDSRIGTVRRKGAEYDSYPPYKAVVAIGSR
jgi:hypothetical protein